MQTRLISTIRVLLCCVLFWGCAGNTAPPVVDESIIQEASKGFHRFDFKKTQPVDTKDFVKKVDNFTIIFDPSASMTEAYTPSNDCTACHINYQDSGFAENHAIQNGGIEFAEPDKKQYALECNRCHHNYLYSKFKFAKELAKNFNQSIPDLDFTGTIRTFGYPVYTNFEYGIKENDNTKFLDYKKNDYARAIDKIFDADGVSPLAPTLKATEKDWYNHKGKIAVIIISDGEEMGEKEWLAAQDLKAKYEEDICIYTILIGKDPTGKKVMDKIAMSGQCGLSINGDDLLDKDKMAQFVHEIFLTKAQPDSDGDGVIDDRDDCPGTKPGLKVDKNGCWDLVLQAEVLFDFDRYTLKPEGIAALDQVVDLLKKHPFLNLHISGHTDNFGTMKYNIKLSKHRAITGLDYLMKKGIDPGRLSISWHSFSIPVATNDTPEGRVLNRRLEFKFKKRSE
ncbi:OmpA family protein [Desulfobacula toluolica]|uniref:Outer membrane protein, related to OmpA/MotB n=1 Tax=Desulfobacula toluolica (strain DSM 7467 / Tol2) TaxID=651182 RepID=K0NBQ7_DESTT|nr:OmpA family protein [Desulfobacula toluolica]CCK81804.1 outer membrane protein, related to OmpA/MotB [Desulfobacula toluolica Tol2]